jgi:hypothetical protein
MKEETLEQIKEFSESLARMNKGDLSINSQISQMKTVSHNIICRPQPQTKYFVIFIKTF